MAILEELNREGVVTLVTTHLSELKAFAHQLDQTINAAMQFDFKTLSPLFKLEIGIPGSRGNGCPLQGDRLGNAASARPWAGRV